MHEEARHHLPLAARKAGIGRLLWTAMPIRATHIHGMGIKELLRRKQRIGSRMRGIWERRLGTEMCRRIPYEEVSPLLQEIRAIEIAIDFKRRKLAKVVYCMAQELDGAIREGELPRAMELVRPVRVLAGCLYAERRFQWRPFVKCLRKYQARYHRHNQSAYRDYVSMLLDAGVLVGPE